MQNLILILSFFVLLFASCIGQDNNGLTTLRIADTSTKFREEIPTYKDGPRKGDTEYLFKAIRQDAAQLGLDFIENGFDSLQVRVWLGHSMAVNRNIVILKKTNGQWTGQLLTYTSGYSLKDQKDFIEKKEIKKIYPKTSWKSLIESLANFQILSLPNGENIKDYNSCGGEDGITYYFEVATNKGYRFYYYCNPEENIKQFWQVKNVLNFQTYLRKSLILHTRSRSTAHNTSIANSGAGRWSNRQHIACQLWFGRKELF